MNRTLTIGIGAAAVAIIGLFFGLGGASLFASGPQPPNVKFQTFELTYNTVTVGDKVTLKFNAANNDQKSYSAVFVKLSADNTDAEKYLSFDKSDIQLGSLGPAHSATPDVSRDIKAIDGVADNPLKFRIKATLWVEGIQTDEKTFDISINPK